jgi:cyclopropane fatty-acyl-phospholipid synthase-like methyltransferase
MLSLAVERYAIMQLKQSNYVLGHTDHDKCRLIKQARVLAPATEHFLRDAGIVPGMRVLDIGCEMGDVTILVAQLVGPQGKVMSIDINCPEACDSRRARKHDVPPSRHLGLH